MAGVFFTIRNIKTEKEVKKFEHDEVVKKPKPPKKLYNIAIKDFIVETNVVKSGSTLSDILYPAGISYARIEEEGLQWPCPTEDHPGTR